MIPQSAPIVVDVAETTLSPVTVTVEMAPGGQPSVCFTVAEGGEGTFVLRLSPRLARQVVVELAASLEP